MVAVQPVQNNAKIDIVALSGAYYLLSDMKKGETGEEIIAESLLLYYLCKTVYNRGCNCALIN